MSNDLEQARLRRANAFDRAALAAIYDEYQQPIYRYVYRNVGEVEIARDLTAEVFHRFLQAIQREQGPTRHLRAWLYRAAHNSVIDHFRRQKHRQHLPLNEELVNTRDDPVTLAEGRLSAAAVRAALQELTDDQRQVIILKFIEGLSNAEAANVLDKPIGAIKSLQHRALAALQRHLAVPQQEMW
ncbi:MAG: ECF RNA polymerase sigma factor SigW [Anaerolineae bacterium]|nr:ECF RNA polymerase sigma factor SigW [Anaerolineae bacterium]